MNELKEKFEKMGARVRVTTLSGRAVTRLQRRRWRDGWQVDDEMAVRLDVQRDLHGEYFDLHRRNDIVVEVLHLDASDRHLLLRVSGRMENRGTTEDSAESTFLCGHDERSWFVAAIPERSRATSVQDAKDALKPAEVWEAMRAYGVPLEDRDRRRTAAFVRQGEWFFVPRPSLVVKPRDVLRHEPIRRGAAKPHMCQFLYRYNGERVWVNEDHPDGLTPVQFAQLSRKTRRLGDWREMMRGATVFVRGAISHPDHDTVHLGPWHLVVMNTENDARAMAHVAFLD
jgi:hypothetical protein